MTRQDERPLHDQHDSHDSHDDDALLARLTLDDRPGPATRISSARAHAMVESALDAVLADVAAAARASAPPTPPTPAPSVGSKQAAAWLLAQSPLVRALTLAAAALLVLAGGAAAARLVGWMREEPAAPAPATSPAKSAARASSARPAPSRLPPTRQVASPVEPPEPAMSELYAPRAGASRVKDVREGALEDLLQQANRARADGEFREAAELYAQVYESRPSSLSAYVALVAAGSLELEHLDRPARARKLFEAALSARPKGALDLEARQGLVLALRDLAARDDEVAALRRLIALHPMRPAATRARARLAELGE